MGAQRVLPIAQPLGEDSVDFLCRRLGINREEYYVGERYWGELALWEVDRVPAPLRAVTNSDKTGVP